MPSRGRVHRVMEFSGLFTRLYCVLNNNYFHIEVVLHVLPTTLSI